MSRRDPYTGRLIYDERHGEPSQRDIRRAEKRREVEKKREELELQRQYDPSYYLFEGDE